MLNVLTGAERQAHGAHEVVGGESVAVPQTELERARAELLHGEAAVRERVLPLGVQCSSADGCLLLGEASAFWEQVTGNNIYDY